MKKHLFLTGEKQVGKTTAIEKFLEMWPGEVAGFVTRSQVDQQGRRVYVCSPDGKRKMEAGHFTTPEHKAPCDPRAFEGLAVELLRQSARPGCVTLMDELGFMESGIRPFTQAVLERLALPWPVLGVLRLEDNPFLRSVAEHPMVRVVMVTKENRDKLPRLLYQYYTTEDDWPEE